MARRVRLQAMTEDAAAENMPAGFPLLTSCKPASEEATPTMPAMSAKMTKNPVARFPIG